MGNWIVPRVLVLIMALNYNFQANSFSLDQPYWLSIDCGSTSQYQDEINKELTWQTDENYTNSGENKFLVSVNTSFIHMKTLRSFPTGNKNCYSLPLQAQSKYLVRAGFLYANYDNLQKPPRFVLKVVGYGNVTVAISEYSDVYKPVYHEFFIVTKTKTESVDVCLIRTEEEHNDVPFISSLEATLIGSWTYEFLMNRTAFYVESRISYGANQSVPSRLSYKAETFNRIWEPQEIPKYRSLSDDTGSDSYATRADNNPPFQVLKHAIVARNSSESITLPVKFRRSSSLQAYFVFYLAAVTDADSFWNETRTVSIFVDGQEKNTTVVPYWYSLQEAAVVSVFPVIVSGGSATVTISAAQGSTLLPPIINAVEVFSVVVDNKAVAFSSFPFGGFSILGLALLIFF